MTHTAQPHVDEGMLIQLLDGACTPADARRVREHLADCPACRRAMTELRTLSETFDRVLQRDAVATEQHVRWWGRPAVRVAAALIVVVGTMFVVPPARAWLIDRWEAVKGLFTPGLTSEAPPPEAPTEPIVSRVSLDPRGDVFTITLASPQRAGTLTVDVGTGPAYAEIVGQGEDELIVAPTGLRIGNASASSASYRVHLPAALAAVEIRLGDRTIGRRPASELLTPWVVDLARQP